MRKSVGGEPENATGRAGDLMAWAPESEAKRSRTCWGTNGVGSGKRSNMQQDVLGI